MHHGPKAKGSAPGNIIMLLVVQVCQAEGRPVTQEVLGRDSNPKCSHCLRRRNQVKVGETQLIKHYRLLVRH